MNFKLFKHQEEALKFIRNNPHAGTLLHHEMGLGKTLCAVLSFRELLSNLRAKGVMAPKVLMLLPKSLEPQWRSELLKFAPDIYSDIVFLPYSQLNKAKHLTMYYDIRAIGMDESHYMKSQGTKRMTDFCALLDSIAVSPGKFIGGKYICLSGTPMLNHAGELYTTWCLLTSKNPSDAAERMKDVDGYGRWKDSFTKKKLKSWKTRHGGVKYGNDTVSGVDNEDKFTQLLGPVTHIRKAKDCLDLPDKLVSEVDLGIQDDKLLRDVDIEKPEAYMAILERLARAKTPHAIEWIKNFLSQSNEKLVVFCPYRFPLDDIAEKTTKCVFVTGAQNLKERQANIKSFTEGKARVFLGTYGAAGVGLNLQSAYTSLYLGYPWTPGQIAQAIARTHRQGQKNRTRHYFLTSGQCDSRILNLIRGKEAAINTVEDSLANYEKDKAASSVDSFI